MKIVAITGVKQCEIIEKETPTVKEDFCLIKIMSAAMCTECNGYRKGDPTTDIGHEAAGEVVEAGPKSKIKVGERVVVMPQNPCGKCHLCLKGDYIHCQHTIDPHEICNTKFGRSTYGQYCIQRDWLLMPIPDDISYDHAVMACCGLGPTFNAVNRLGVNPHKTVAIAGLGPVGLGGVINASYLGGKVIALDINPYRLKLAKELGAMAAIDPTADNALEQILELTDGEGLDCSVETSNVPSSPPFLINAARRKGEIALVSWAGDLSVPGIVGRGLTVYGCWHWNHFTHTEQMINVIRNNKEKLDKLITHTFPLEDVKEAWELQLTGQCGKVILHPN